MRIQKTYLFSLIVAIYAPLALSHAEHDKARFVAKQGSDKGRCDSPLRPCKSIGYAVEQASKGDKILVASGTYKIQSLDELFYLRSETVPVLAGYNRFDHFQVQSPQTNLTTLVGVPSDMQASLSRRGFNFVNDTKSMFLTTEDQKVLSQMAKVQKQLTSKQAMVSCVAGSASGFPCSNVDLVAHIPLNSMSTNPAEGKDIWGHIDLNTGNEYALFTSTNGIAVFDLSDPDSPSEVGTIAGSASFWRDVKVYQFFNQSSNRWEAYAYAVADGTADGIRVIDLNNLPDSVSLVEQNFSAATSHNIYISNVDHSLNIRLENLQPALQLVGSNVFGGAFHSYSLSNPRTIVLNDNQSSFNGYTHDAASLLVDDSRAQTDCALASGQNCSVLIDFNEKEIFFWNISDPEQTEFLSQASYSDVSFNNKYVHSGWATEDKQFVLVHDEQDELAAGLNSTVRILDISSITSPALAGIWNGETRAIDHNGFVRGNRYYISNYTRGLTILDISDPSNPTEVGFFDTFPSSNGPSFNGAWGVYPFLPSGLILVSDINSGLYVLRDNTLNSDQGTLNFEVASIDVQPDSSASVSVLRSGNSTGAVSVHYELISGSAESATDFVLQSGILSWQSGESGSQSFEVQTLADSIGQDLTEEFYVRLFNPQGGATLSQPNYMTVKVVGAESSGSLQFSNEQLRVAETDNLIQIPVRRVGGAAGVASISYQTQAGSALEGEDYTATSGALNWSDGETSDKLISLEIIDDGINENDESLNLILSSASGAQLGDPISLEIVIADNESNTPPTVDLGLNFEANTRQIVNITANASDADNDALIYEWSQTEGESVGVDAQNSSQISFVAPASEQQLAFSVVVTDINGAEATDNIRVTIVAPATSSGGGNLFYLLLLLPWLRLFRKS